MTADQLSTDLAKAMVRKPSGTGLGIASATILTWDSSTLRGTLDYQGTILKDIPVLSGTDALTWQAGDEVILDTWHPPDGHRRRGFGSFMIRGRVVRPGSAHAQRIISFLQTELARQIVDEIVTELLSSPAGEALARFIISETMRTATVFGIGERNNTAYGDLSFVDPGPVISDVEISAAGKAVVALSCSMTAHISAGRQGFMSVEVTGDTARSPDDNRAFVVGVGGDPALAVDPTGQASEFVVLEGLNPGVHEFHAKYRTLTTDGPVQFTNPEMIVWAF